MGRGLGVRPGRGAAPGALRVRRLALLLLVAVVAAGCTGSDDPETAAPTTVAETTTVPPSTTSTTVRATTTTTGPPRTTTTTLVTLGPGDATIGGTVTGPAGPVDGATVRVERLVGRSVASADVTTSGGGLWQLASVLGGSYRVRAFKPPELGTSPIESFFLAATERRMTIDFRLPAVGGERITAVVNPDPPRVDQPAIITITIGIGRVDDQGRPAITPRPGVPLTLVGGPGIVVESAPMVVTDGNGAASWRIRCSAEGANTVSLTVGTGVTQVRFENCGPPVATPTTRQS